MVQGLIVPGEGEQHDGQTAQHHDVDGPVEGDEAQHVAVAQGRAAQRELDLVPALDPLATGLLRLRAPDPVVAAQAPVPARRTVLVHEQPHRRR